MPPNDSPSGTQDGLGNAFHYGGMVPAGTSGASSSNKNFEETIWDALEQPLISDEQRLTEIKGKLNLYFDLKDSSALLLIELRLRRKQKAELATKRQERISLLAKKSQYPSLQRELLVGSWNSPHYKLPFSFIMVGEDVR